VCVLLVPFSDLNIFSLFMQQKQRIREGLKKEKASAFNAAQITSMVVQGQEETGTRGECVTSELQFSRPSGAFGSKKGALIGISSLYHFSYVFSEEGMFEGLRVWAHEGIGGGKFFTADACSEMWEDEGLTKEMVGELRHAESTLPPGHAARIRASGHGARMIRGDEHKADDEAAAEYKRQRQRDAKILKEEEARLKREQALTDARVHVCEHCTRPFIKLHPFNSHVTQCKAQLERQSSLKVRVPLRPGSEMAKDAVHSAASLGIGEGVESRGEDNRMLHLPHSWDFVNPKEAPPVTEGWARKNVGRKSTKFTETQIQFLRRMFDAHLDGGYKVKESEAHAKMREQFNDKNADAPYSKRLVLTQTQIKSWFSTEKSRRTAAGKRLVAKTVIEKAATEVAAQMHVPDSEEADEEAGGQGSEVGGNGDLAEMEGEETQRPVEVAGEKEVEEGRSGGGEGVGNRLTALGSGGLIKGNLYVVVREEWEDDKAFEVWELEEDVGGWTPLNDEQVLQSVRGRKWVHDITLLQKGDQTEVATDLPDKPTGGGKLGKKGQRRFAPSTGRRWSQFVTIQPAQWGAVWLKIGGEKLEMYGSRVSFVFRSQGVVVDRAYTALSNRDGEDE